MTSTPVYRSETASYSLALARIGPLLLYYGINALNAATPLSIVLTLPVLLTTLVVLGRIRSPYLQVADMLWFCVYIFFAIGPLQSMAASGVIGPAGRARYVYNDFEYVMAMAIALLFVVPLAFVPHGSIEFHLRPARPPWRRLLLAVNVVSALAFVVAQGGLANLLAARLEQSADDRFIGGFLFLGLQTVSAALFLGEARAASKLRKWWPAVLLVLGLLLLTRNPFNASRFTLVAAWFPVAIVLLRGRIAIAKFYLACALALTVAFPILSETTRRGVGAIEGIVDIDYFGFALHLPFIDIFDTLVHAVRYVDEHGLAWGAKTVAVVLFFIPRALWPEKPIVGGLDVGYELLRTGYAGTANLSFLLGGDFYLDFHLVGVAILSAATAQVLGLAIRSRMGHIQDIPILRIALIASLPILLRGPVGAVLPLFCCQVAAIVLLRSLSPAASRTRGSESLRREANAEQGASR